MFDPILSTSLQYVAVDISAYDAGLAINPTNDVVQMAFVAPDATPQSGDLVAAFWETNATGRTPVYTALCLVGPGGTVTLTAGKYRVCVKVTDSPEIPILVVPGLLSVL